MSPITVAITLCTRCTGTGSGMGGDIELRIAGGYGQASATIFNVVTSNVLCAPPSSGGIDSDSPAAVASGASVESARAR